MSPGTGIGENEHIVSALAQKRAVTAKALQTIEREMQRQRAELEHIEAVLRIFDPNFLTESSSAEHANSDGSSVSREKAAPHAGALLAAPGNSQTANAKMTAQISGQRQKQRVRYFRRGELPELCLDVLRSSQSKLMQSDGIADEINRKKGFVSGAERFKAATATQTRPVLRALAKRGMVRRVGSGKGSKWKLAIQENGASV
jgi:hypothetical protein